MLWFHVSIYTIETQHFLQCCTTVHFTLWQTLTVQLRRSILQYSMSLCQTKWTKNVSSKIFLQCASYCMLVGAVLLSEHLEFAVKMFSVESCSIQEACFNHWHCMGQSRDCYSESIPHAMFTITGLWLLFKRGLYCKCWKLNLYLTKNKYSTVDPSVAVQRQSLASQAA